MIFDYEKDLNILQQKTRIRSKKFLNILDLVESELKTHELYHFFLTLNLGFKNDENITLEDTWMLILPEVEKLIEEVFFESNNICFGMRSIEIHRSKVSIKKKNKQFIKINKKNSLEGYPHMHLILSFGLNPYSYTSENHLIDSVNTFLLNKFIDYDIKIDTIQHNQKHNLKKTLKYILKEYKLKDIDKNLTKILPSSKAIHIYCTKKWNYMINIINKFDDILDFDSNLIELSTTFNFLEKKADPINKLECFVKSYMNKYSLKCFNNNIYVQITGHSLLKHTWFFRNTLEDFIYNVAEKFAENRHLILSNKKYFLDLCYKTNMLDNLTFEGFQYIEFHDFFFDLHKGKFLKKDFNCNSFNAFDCKVIELLRLIDGINCLKNIFKDENHFVLFLKKFGIILSNLPAIKGSTIYLYGPSNAGKSLITEKFLIDIFGVHNIGILNLSDSKFILDQVADKHIIVLNEFTYKKNLRDFYLKFLDGTLIDINIKFRSSFKANISSHKIANSNYKLNHFNADSAFSNRFVEIEVDKTINEKDYAKIKQCLPLFIILSRFSLPLLNKSSLNYEDIINRFSKSIESIYQDELKSIVS